MKECILCGKNNAEIVFKDLGADILKCGKCGHFYSSIDQSQDYGGYYEKEEINEEDNFWWNKAHEKMYNDFCDRFIKNKSGKLLDVGCGLGYFVKKASSFSKWQVFGYEMSKPAVKFAKEKLNLKNIFYGRVEDSDFEEKSFDIITLWDVIEHIPNPHGLLSYLNKILKDDGFLFIHTPNIKIQLPKAKIKKMIKGIREGGHYMEAKDHVNIYSMETMSKVLERNNFLDVEFIHIHPIQSVAGSKSIILKFIKNLWFHVSKFLYFVSFKKVNINNLFVIARK